MSDPALSYFIRCAQMSIGYAIDDLDRLITTVPSELHKAALAREHPANLQKLAQDLETLRDSFLRHQETSA